MWNGLSVSDGLVTQFAIRSLRSLAAGPSQHAADVADVHASVWLPLQPSTHSRSVSHVCPAFMQLAMLLLGTDIPMLIPWSLDLDKLAAALCNVWSHPTYERIMQHLSTRNIDALLTDTQVHQMLGTVSLVCGGEPHPLTLHSHLNTAHPSECSKQMDLLPQLLQQFTKLAVTDHHCPVCQAVFNLPATGTETADEVEDRELLVQVHLQHQCPVVLQIGLLLCHGHPGISSHLRRGEPGTSSSFQRDGPAVTGQAKRRRTGAKKSTEDSAPQPGSGDSAGRCQTAPEGHGSNGDQARSGHAGGEEARLLSLLHAKRSPSLLAAPGGHSQAVAPQDVSARPDAGLIDLCALESDSGSNHDPGPHAAHPEVEPEPNHRSDLRGGCKVQPEQPGRIFPLPPLECPGEEIPEHGPTWHSHGPDDPLRSAS